MPSMLKVSEYLEKTSWVQETLESLKVSGNLDDDREIIEVDKILDTNEDSKTILDTAIKNGQISFISFWITKTTVNMSFNAASKIMARKGI